MDDPEGPGLHRQACRKGRLTRPPVMLRIDSPLSAAMWKKA